MFANRLPITGSIIYALMIGTAAHAAPDSFTHAILAHANMKLFLSQAKDVSNEVNIAELLAKHQMLTVHRIIALLPTDYNYAGEHTPITYASSLGLSELLAALLKEMHDHWTDDMIAKAVLYTTKPYRSMLLTAIAPACHEECLKILSHELTQRIDEELASFKPQLENTLLA